MDGAIVLDKPEGITSHDAVAAARRLLSERRIGHLGTLDPFAGGVLVLLVGRATRLARFYREREKTYEGVIRFGFSTTTFDRDGEPTSPERPAALAEPELRSLFREFLGTRLQQPPSFSAKKISGVPAYRLMRKGRAVALAAVPVTISELDLVAIESPLVRFRARVSAGAYIRSLAHELGERLGVGAHLAELRRTAVGEFTEADALSLDALEEKVRRGENPVIPLRSLLPELPEISLTEQQAAQAAHGHDLEISCDRDIVRLFDAEDRLVAVAVRGERKSGGFFHPLVVLRAPGDVTRSD
jgi:tRNA pseudouridine55 synthase